MSNLKIIYTNADTLTNKLDELKMIIETKQPDIIAITEIYPKTKIFELDISTFYIKGYQKYTNQEDAGRGVIIYVKDDLNSSSVEFGNDKIESIWTKIKLSNNDILLIGCIYRSPNSSNNSIIELGKLLEEACSCGCSHLCIMGDFNFKEINWEKGDTNTNETHPANIFLELTRDNFLTQHVKQATRYRDNNTPSILDLVLTNEENMIDEITHLPGLGKSDHEILEIKFSCYTTRVKKLIHKRNYHKGNYTDIGEDILSIDWDSALDGTINESWDTLADKLNKFIDDHIPVCKENPRHSDKLPFIDRETKEKLNKKHRTWKKYIHCKTHENFEKFKSARNKATEAIKLAKYNYENDLSAKININNKLFWNYVRKNSKTTSNIGNLHDTEGNIIDDDRERANMFNNYFASVFNANMNSALPIFREREYASVLSDIHFTEENVLKAIKGLNPNKSPGPDGIHPKLLVECKDQLKIPLTKILNKSMTNGEIPKQWKKANVTPIYKSGNKHKPENYRPISISSVCSNIMQRIVKNNITEHMIRNDLFSKHQFGFMKGKSCPLQLLEALEDWTDALDNGNEIDIIFYDFKKAFDTLPHNKLLQKIEAYGIKGKLLAWIKDFLSNRTQEVVINTVHSNEVPVLSGVPQGSVLGPTLFLIFINDLPEVAETTVKLFADDTKTYNIVNCREDHDQLQRTTDQFSDWSHTWDLEFNAKKCKRLHLGNYSHPEDYFMKGRDLSREVIVNVEEEKDLGVIVDKNLKFHTHITSKIKIANRNLGIIFRTFTYMDKTIFLHLYKSLVRPHLEYASTVWSPHLRKHQIAIENVQRRATKLLSNIQFLPYTDRLKHLGIPSLEYRRLRADMLQVFKILFKYDQTSKKDFLTLSKYTRTRGNSLKLFKKSSNTALRKNAFSIRIVDHWNSLPDTVVLSPSINTFKNSLNKHWINHPAKFNPRCHLSTNNVLYIRDGPLEAVGFPPVSEP